MTQSADTTAADLAMAFRLRHAQRAEEALDVLEALADSHPGDARIAFARAQIAFECWRPAADLFAAARRLSPDQPDLVRNQALALAAEDMGEQADALLDGVLLRNPLWLDGHRTLASLRTTAGDGRHADASYARACSQLPDEAGLRLAWFHHHAMARNWIAADKVLNDAPAAQQASDGHRMARLFWRSESGDTRLEEAALEPFAGRADPGFDLCRLRYHLRRRETAKAAAIAERHLAGGAARHFWPYLGLCWRMANDRRSAWLDGDPLLAATVDLDWDAGELAVLADVLRRLHRMKAPYPEQSVRGGTQTDRQLFFHPDPAIQRLRAKVTAAVTHYISHLPERDPNHPLLAHRHGPVRFEGSWSVRLAGGGHHASHTHNMGWISSALYVALPDGAGPPPAGWLALGAPPPELALELAPYDRVEPRPGRLVLFPSTLWHATEPFDQGERLTVAFDVKIPEPGPDAVSGA